MENWTVREEDRPYLRPPRKSQAWLYGFAGAAVLAAAGAYIYYSGLLSREAPPPPPAPVAQKAPEPAPAPADVNAIRHPVEAEPAQGLPTVENSDSMLRSQIAELMGRKAFGDLVVPDQIVRRIVATVDNLPRPTAPRRMLPLNPVPGRFATEGSGDSEAIAAANAARYEPYVRVMESVNTHALVYSYKRAYPLFQKAYEELGFPGKYFNDRLVAAIDDMLAAPDPETAPKLVRGRVLYEFADPDLETRSAGQKILVRMGRENALRVKAKLTEVRQELAAAPGKKP
ncbi:MAG: DUF3014 domain-containing protein [Clostridia bacterium]